MPKTDHRFRPSLAHVRRAAMCTGVMMLCLASAASAGPWPQRQGHGLIISSLSYLEAHNSLERANPAVGNGQFSRLALNLYGEYGLTNSLTLGVSSRLERLYLDGPSISEETIGVPDVELFARPVLWRSGNSILAAQGTLIVPTGYDRARNPALGDGAVGLEPRILFGQGFTLGSWPSFFDIEPAYRFRFGDPADQVHVDATLGSHLTDKWMVLLQSRNTISVQNQAVISAPGPGFSGSSGTDYDLYSVTLSAVRDISSKWSVELGVTKEVAGRNYSLGNGGFIALWRRF